MTGNVLSANHFDILTLSQQPDDGVTGHPTDIVYFPAGNRLTVGNDGESFQGCTRKTPVDTLAVTGAQLIV